SAGRAVERSMSVVAAGGTRFATRSVAPATRSGVTRTSAWYASAKPGAVTNASLVERNPVPDAFANPSPAETSSSVADTPACAGALLAVIVTGEGDSQGPTLALAVPASTGAGC